MDLTSTVKLSELPDDRIPELRELPGDLSTLAAIIDAAVPGEGVRVVLRLVDELGGTSVYIHGMDDFKRTLRDTAIIAAYGAGFRVPEIARKVGLSERQVWAILGREPGEDKQLKLF